MADAIKKPEDMTEAELQAAYDKMILNENIDNLSDEEVKYQYELMQKQAQSSPTTTTTPSNAPDFKSWQLPLLGSVLGGVIGGGASMGLGSIPGAAIGAATGKTAENVLRGIYDQPVSRLEAYAGPLVEGAIGSAGEVSGLGLQYAGQDLAKSKLGQLIGKGIKGVGNIAAKGAANISGMSPMEINYWLNNYPDYLKLAGMEGKDAFKYANELRAKFNEQIKKGKQAQNKILDQVRNEAQQTPISIPSLDRIQGNLQHFLNNLPKGEVLGDEAKIIQNEIDLIERMKTRKLSPQESQMLADYDTKLNAYLDAGGDPSQASFEAYLADQQRTAAQPELVRMGDAIVRGNLGESLVTPGKIAEAKIPTALSPDTQYPLDIAPQYPGPRPVVEGQPELSMNELLGLQERLKLLSQSEFGKKLGFTKGTAADKALKGASAETNTALNELAQNLPFLKQRLEANKVLSEMRTAAKPISPKMFEENQPITPILSLSKETPEGVANSENMRKLNALSGGGSSLGAMEDLASAVNAKKAYDTMSGFKKGIGYGSAAGGLLGGYSYGNNQDQGVMRNFTAPILIGGGLGALLNPKMQLNALRTLPATTRWTRFMAEKYLPQQGAQDIKNYLGVNYGE